MLGDTIWTFGACSESVTALGLQGFLAAMHRCVFYLIRHAHAEWTPDEQRPLSAQGMVDAICVADALDAAPISHIYSSPYRRAIQTIKPLADRLRIAIEVVDDLRERALGRPKTAASFVAAVEETWRNPSFAHPDGESNQIAQERAVTVVKRLSEAHQGGQVVLSTHGNLLALLVNQFDARCGFDFWKALTMPDIYALHLEFDAVALHRLWQDRD